MNARERFEKERAENESRVTRITLSILISACVSVAVTLMVIHFFG